MRKILKKSYFEYLPLLEGGRAAVPKTNSQITFKKQTEHLMITASRDSY